MNVNQHVKSVNKDPRAKNRIKFASAKQRAKQASADVYRTYKRRTGVVTTAASREERVHHEDQFYDTSSRKKRRTISTGRESKAVVASGVDFDESEDELELQTNSTFQMELDLAKDRNASALFSKLYYEASPFVASLPEILHHAEKIVKILISYVLSPSSTPHLASPEDLWIKDPKQSRELFVVNSVTTDVLHLLSVLARDLRHEIHPYVHDIILPRIVNDLINPPTNIMGPHMKQQLALDVTVVETGFRAMSYIFRYDTNNFISENVEGITKTSKKDDGCLELMRKYYGPTLAHRADFVRRLAAESFAPLVRKLRSDSSKKKHIRRVVRALVTSASMSATFSEEPPPDYAKDCYVPSVTLTSKMEKAGSDAIDGVALLLFYTIRGVPGRLHSKSQTIVKMVIGNLVQKEVSADAQDGNVQSYKNYLTYKLVSRVFYKARGHVHSGPNFSPIWDEIYKSLDNLVSALQEGKNHCAHSLGYLTQLMTECIAYGNGALLRTKDVKDSPFENDQANTISLILQRILEPEFYCLLGNRNKAHALNLLCAAWKMFPDHPTFSVRLCAFIPTIAKGSFTIVDPIVVLAKDLLPFVSDELASTYLAPEILKAAARRNSEDGAFGVLRTLHALATSSQVEDTDTIHSNDFEEKDELFSTKLAPKCMIPCADKAALINTCLQNYKMPKSDLNKRVFTRLTYITRVLPFLALVGCDGSDADDFTLVQKITKSIIVVLKRLNASKTQSHFTGDIIVTKALMIEAIAFIASGCPQDSARRSAMKKVIKQARSITDDFFLHNPNSLLAVKSSAKMAMVLKEFDLYLTDDANETFDKVVTNLKSSNHFMRLHSLQLLSTFPQRPFVTDFGDVDLSEDLDENEFQSKKVSLASSSNGNSKLRGMCDIIETLLYIENTSPGLENERRLTVAINRVDVLGRSGKLPELYAEAAVNHMFGILHIKFQSIWSASVRAIAGLISGHEMAAWPAIASQLQVVMESSYYSNNAQNSEAKDTSIDTFQEDEEMIRDHELILQWDSSSGQNAELFRQQIDAAKRVSKVSRHHSTDQITIFEQVLSVLENAPHLTTKKSRVIVPLFFNFLHRQYFIFHDDDCDAREFNLKHHLDSIMNDSETITNDSERTIWTRDQLGRKMLQKKLVSFMRIFAHVHGMQQLFKHGILLVIFTSFLSNPDPIIAQISLECIIRFKLPHVRPYHEDLKGLLAKGKLRETVTKLSLSRQNGHVDDQHRELLFPIIIRLLFGRLAARGSGNKSSKDSPAVRRAAILSFLSGLDDSKGELDYFVYIMIRPFVPRSVDMDLSTIGHGDKVHIKDVIKQVHSIASKQEVSLIPSQRQEGLLNLLSDVVKKLGFKIFEYIPTYVKLTLAMLEHTESLRKHSSEPEIDADETNGDDEISSSGASGRTGKIRALCFLRLSEIMSQFAETADFTPFKDEIETIIEPALKNLPSSTINAENAPGLLVLLQTISSHSKLLPLLENYSSAIRAVFQCISDSSNFVVMDCALKFVDNLLTEGGLHDPEEDLIDMTGDRIGLKLVRDHVDLLLSQFAKRLRGSDYYNPASNQLSSRELSILCHITRFVAGEASSNSQLSETLGTLCNLLVPFLGFSHNIRERNQLEILSILGSILSRIKHEIAFSHLQAFARLLGPNRGKIGIRSAEVRQSIITCIGAIATNENEVSSGLSTVVAAMENLNAFNPKRVDEWDFEKILPVLIGLGNESNAEGSWFSYAKGAHLENHGLKILMPLMYCCLQLLYDTDGVLSRGAYKALTMLVRTASNQPSNNAVWQRLISTSLMASIRVGIKTHSLAVRRSFILLLSVVTRSFAASKLPALSSDLIFLIRDDDPELDFFLNITHVQIHRRSRALARLRKFLSEFSDMNDCTISTQSLMTILLPLALHPIYECAKKGEEAYAAEAIATVGTITKYLPWGKYQSTLWTALMQITRHESQERFVVAMVCAVIDSFHFDVTSTESADEDMVKGMDPSEKEDGNNNAEKSENFIWKQLSKKLIPTIESFLMKDTVEKNGSRSKILRPQIVLALIKLCQKLPHHIFIMKLPRLLTVICEALKNKESDEREVARRTLSRVTASIDIKYLTDVIACLSIALNEGYKLHVRSASLHSILVTLLKVYKRPEDTSQENYFDRCVPAMMDIIQQDIFGTASEMKEVESTRKRLVKEAGGKKSLNSLELIGRLIHFNPSSTKSSSSNISAVHILVNPFLERLRDPEVESKIIGKVKEAMSHIVLGISQNSSSSSEQMLPFVYATLSPFIITDDDIPDSDDDLYDSDDDVVKRLEVSKSRKKRKEGTENTKKSAIRKVVNWAPSRLKDAKDSKSAYEMKLQQKLELRKVIDGASAPKLTGSSRYDSLKSKGNDLNSPATSCAVTFGLSLLHAHLKKNRGNNIEMMSDPFVAILTRSVKFSNDTDAILLSLKCLQVLLRLNLPSIPIHRMILAKCVLKILSSMSCNTQNEMVQGSFKTLTLLLAVDRESAIEYVDNTELSTSRMKDSKQMSSKKDSGPILNKGQMQVLISILQSALTDAEHHNSTFGVIKAITSRKFVSPEYYDLMGTILKMTVQNQKANMRLQAAKIFMQYLIEYPMGKKRLESHLKQIVLNVKYEYEDGRMSALDLAKALIQKLPLPLLEEFTQLLFLPLVLQLVNDDSKKCRERVGECLTVFLSRLSTTVLNSLHEYALKWSADNSGEQLQRTSIQLFGLMLDARLDYMKKNNRIEELVLYLSHRMNVEIGSVDHTSVILANEWEMIYFCLQTLEKIGSTQKHLLWTDMQLWELVIKCLAHPHPWVKLAASRTVHSHFSSCHVKHFESINDNFPSSIILKIPGSLFEITRNLCFELNSEEEQQSDDVTNMAIKNLSWIINVMHEYPALCFKDEKESELVNDSDDENAELMDNKKKPVTWLITRLSNIAKKRGHQRREAIFKCFAAFATVCKSSIISDHLELILEPLNRVITDVETREERSTYMSRRSKSFYEPTTSDADLPMEVLQLLEDKCGTDVFIRKLAHVKSQAREKREERKQKRAVEAVQDPESAAKRRIAKQQTEKERKKRRMQERKSGRGTFKKKSRNY